jgi:hypothetical protein
VRSPKPDPEEGIVAPKDSITKRASVTVKPPPFWRNIITFEFWVITYYLVATSISFQWYNSTLFTQFTLMGDSNHYFSTAFNFSLLIVLIIFPFYGIVVKTLGVVGSMIFAILMSVLMIVVLSIFNRSPS